MGTLCDGIEDCPLGVRLRWSDPPGFPDDECRADCSKSINKFNCTTPHLIGVGPPIENLPDIFCSRGKNKRPK